VTEQRLPLPWQDIRLKRVVEVSTARADQRSTEDRFIGLENIEPWTGRFIKSNSIPIKPDDNFDNGSVVNRFAIGDVLFGKLRPYLAKAYLAEESGTCTTEFLVLRPKPGIDAKYLLRNLLSPEFITRVNETTFGARMPRAEWSEIGNIPILVPSLPEQRAIAAYLDHETAQLDALIAATEHLLDLLAEKRRALITHAVTRGLNPDVPLRDSGVEWLGLVPTHWETRKLKMVAEVRTGVAKGRNFGGASTIQVSYLRVANVQDGYLDLSDVAEIEIQPHELDGFRLKKGDLLMNEGGDADKLGRGAIWSGSIDPCVHQNHVFAVRCHDVDPEWLAWTIKGDHAKVYFESRSKQSTNLASISSTNLQEVTIPTPPAGEQRTIVEYIESETAKLAALRAATEHTRDLLHERRAALIAEAVTGKIHVAG